MSLDECLAKHTHRQYLAWKHWLRMQWDRPNRTDHYMMQVAQHIWQGSMRKAIDIMAFHLPKFSFGSHETPVLTPEAKKARITASKQRAMAMTGYKGKK